MKKLLFAFCILFLSATTIYAQEGGSTVPAKFNEVKHNFGNIPQGTPATTTFTFQNTGTTPLVIETAVASCGCTSPEFPKTPVLAGKNGEIKVTYNAAAVGPFTKSVTVKFAGNDKPLMLFIVGTVQQKSTATAMK